MRLSRIVPALLLALSAVAAQGAVKVTLEDDSQFSDLPFASAEREAVLAQLSEHFQQLAARLPPGQDLDIEILDVDLAGRLDPLRRGAGEIRVLRGQADWPRLQLRYALRAGQADLSDMSYLQRLNRYASGDRLRYEKRMIDDWFDTAILAGAQK